MFRAFVDRLLELVPEFVVEKVKEIFVRVLGVEMRVQVVTTVAAAVVSWGIECFSQKSSGSCRWKSSVVDGI